jgi:hypothetical protein
MIQTILDYGARATPLYHYFRPFGLQTEPGLTPLAAVPQVVLLMLKQQIPSPGA